MSKLNKDIYQQICHETAKRVTERYSTSFSRSILFFSKEIRQEIYNIYGFVRFADEIVDTFHEYDKEKMLGDFIAEYHHALKIGHSMNPIIHAFIGTKKKFDIPDAMADAFLDSMKMDLGLIENLNQEEYNRYIYGSAEVVGLMCLKVFVGGNDAEYEKLKPYAQAFGAALQKINFLRDISADYHQLNRTYFPNIDFKNFTEEEKLAIEEDIAHDFDMALKGIKMLPKNSMVAVYLAYRYYKKLFLEIKKTRHSQLFNTRIRVSSYDKSILFMKVYLRGSFNIL